MLPLGTLTNEPPEPMTRDDFIAVQRRLRAYWDGTVNLERREVQRLLDEIRWLRRRLQRVEHAIEPLIEAITRSEGQPR